MIRTTVAGLSRLFAPALLAFAPALLGAQEPAAAVGAVGAGGEPVASTVTRIEVVGGQEPLRQDPDSYLARRELLTYRPFVAGPVPEPPVSERTVFFESPDAEAPVTQVLLQPPEAVTALPPSIFHASGWLVPEGRLEDRFGEVVGLSGVGEVGAERTTVRPFDSVRIRFYLEGTPAVGDEFLLYGVARSIPGLGEVAVPSGRVRVTGVGPDGVEARLVAAYGRSQVGDFVTRTRTFPLSPGLHPAPTEVRLEATLLAFQDWKELYLPGDVAFMDAGLEAGLSVGDELLGVVDAGEGWPARPVARFQVVGVREGGATVRLVATESPAVIRPGLTLVLDRRMP